MKKITEQWLELVTNLADIDYNTAPFITELAEKFSEIFDYKDMDEFKNADCSMTKSTFNVLSGIMRRAFTEGYLLAQMEQKEANKNDERSEERPTNSRKRQCVVRLVLDELPISVEDECTDK